ncbi:DUF2184 domain-containing protein [Paraburkholderia elongata]|uniref:DUF2184 domain-containing protein n=1 Tax=Paraburkholderia elongata TaxID=2675747 RepID=A0A972NSN0_9BURK|nr:DUF2184 domain-containing protein [Paraburkholderia elongata]NPT59096.1 DUF2184 domain-containing protein [Paraburkholderia elongata]
MAKMAYDMSPQDQRAAIEYHRQQWFIDFGDAQMFCRPEWKQNISLAMDAQPQLVTVANSGIPAYLTYFLDPDVLHVLTAKNQATEIFGEKQKGDWTSSALLFPVVERSYEISSYGDYNNNGRAGINTNFPERQPYLYQTICEYGDLEIERAGLAKIGFVAEQKEAAIDGLNKFQNLTYFKGVAGLQNYGALNDPSLYPAVAPIPKANGGLAWLNGTAPNASANEVLADAQQLVTQLINQSSGQIDVRSEFVLAMSPKSEMAMTFTNSFNVNMSDLLRKNFPNLRVQTAIQYGALTAQNPQGSALGEIVQIWAPRATGQDSGYTSFNMKLKSGRIIPDMSSFKQKMSQGTNGFILRQPFAMATMIGV